MRERTKKMLMYFIVFAVVMLFAGFTSAYIVSNVGQYWVHIQAPTTLWISNALIVASSLPMWLSLRAMKQGHTMTSFIHLAITFTLGVAFTVMQLIGWGELQDKGMGWTVDETASGGAKPTDGTASRTSSKAPPNGASTTPSHWTVSPSITTPQQPNCTMSRMSPWEAIPSPSMSNVTRIPRRLFVHPDSHPPVPPGARIGLPRSSTESAS